MPELLAAGLLAVCVVFFVACAACLAAMLSVARAVQYHDRAQHELLDAKVGKLRSDWLGTKRAILRAFGREVPNA